ncbi:MAG: DUF6538 domain-containing protein [Nitrosomonadales bacterium]
MSIKYSILRGGTFYFYRKVPVAFQDAEGIYVRQSTGTSDPLKAAPIIKALNSEAEARWTGKAKALDNETVQAKGIRFLAQFGLEPNGDHDDHALDHFIETVVTPHREALRSPPQTSRRFKQPVEPRMMIGAGLSPYSLT